MTTENATHPVVPAMKTVTIRWTEVSTHKVTVNVLAGLDLDALDLTDSLAQLEHDGFQGLDREGVRIEDRGGALDPNAEVFNPS